MTWFTRTMSGGAALLLTVLAAGCSGGGGSSATDTASAERASTSTADDDDESRSGLDPCALLDVAEVEAALGKLAGPPYRQGQDGPEAGGGKCVYEAATGRSIRVGAMSEGAAAIMKMLALPAGMAKDAGMKGKLPLPEGATFAGDWDEARIVGCCLINAMLGDAMVDLEFAASRLDMKQAATLVNAALSRLDKPLRLKGDAGVEAALAREARKPKQVPACQLVSRAEAESVLGPLLADPSGEGNECAYRFTLHAANNYAAPREVQLKVQWRGGYASLRESVQMTQQVMGSLTGRAPVSPAGASPQLAGPWEESASAIDFMAVKKDVLMRVDLRLAPEALATKIVAKAMEKI